jgi:hypothetical protein
MPGAVRRQLGRTGDDTRQRHPLVLQFQPRLCLGHVHTIRYEDPTDWAGIPPPPGGTLLQRLRGLSHSQGPEISVQAHHIFPGRLRTIRHRWSILRWLDPMGSDQQNARRSAVLVHCCSVGALQKEQREKCSNDFNEFRKRVAGWEHGLLGQRPRPEKFENRLLGPTNPFANHQLSGRV